MLAHSPMPTRFAQDNKDALTNILFMQQPLLLYLVFNKDKKNKRIKRYERINE